jgi:chromosome segregation ATPase
MIVEKSLRRAGLTLEADSLPKKDRKVKSFQRLIAAMRATEAEVLDRLGESEQALNKALRENLELQDRLHILERELQKVRLKEHLDSIEALTVADRTKLLGVAGNGTN